MHNKYEIPSALLLIGSVVMGAMWANGPVANSSLRLVSANHAGSVDVRTDESGVNRALIPNARGLVFNEVNDTRVYQTGSRIPAEWTNASIRCKQATVVIGPFIRVN
jgi:sugar lactone lactonase YvrE